VAHRGVNRPAAQSDRARQSGRTAPGLF